MRAANWLRSSHELAEWGCGAMQRHKFLGEAAEAPEIKQGRHIHVIFTMLEWGQVSAKPAAACPND